MDNKKVIGKLIKRAREIKGNKMDSKYTGQMLADELEISRSFLGDIESGRKKAPESLLNKIILICGLDNDFFSTIDDSDSEHEDMLNTIPSEFINPDEARKYISMHKIFASEGFNLEYMADEEVLDFANEMLRQLELIGHKYKK